MVDLTSLYDSPCGSAVTTPVPVSLRTCSHAIWGSACVRQELRHGLHHREPGLGDGGRDVKNQRWGMVAEIGQAKVLYRVNVWAAS